MNDPNRTNANARLVGLVVALTAMAAIGAAPAAADGPALVCTPGVYGVQDPICGVSTGGDTQTCELLVTEYTNADGLAVLRTTAACRTIDDPDLENCDTAEGSQTWAVDLAMAGGLDDDYASGGLDCGETENVLWCEVTADEPECLGPPLCADDQEQRATSCDIPGGDALCWAVLEDTTPHGATVTVNCWDPWVPVTP